MPIQQSVIGQENQREEKTSITIFLRYRRGIRLMYTTDVEQTLSWNSYKIIVFLILLFKDGEIRKSPL